MAEAQASANDAAMPNLRADIGESTFFKLLLLVNLTAKPFAVLYERRFRLSLAEWRVMLTLALRPGLSAGEVGEALGLDKMAISRAVAALERRGRLMRKPDEADRRRFSLELTEAGLALYNMIAPSARERENLLLASLDEAERATLDALLDKLVTDARRMPGS